MAEEYGLTSSVALVALSAILAVQLLTGLAVFGLGRGEVALGRWLSALVSGAAGVLLATACLDLLPEAVHLGGGAPGVWMTVLVSLLLLFCLEAWAHHLEDAQGADLPFGGGHDDALHSEVLGGDPRGEDSPSCDPSANHLHGRGHAALHGMARPFPGEREARTLRVAPLLFGSALHSMVDGLAIAAAFAAGSRPGWTAAIAVGLHELPHRLGDFSLLLHRGIPRRRAARLAVGAGAGALAGPVVLLFVPAHAVGSHWLLAVSAATFLYIALADLMPELHARRGATTMWLEVGCLLGGAALMWVFTALWRQ